jgi:predicted DNA-binding transcriptional regulator YafY
MKIDRLLAITTILMNKGSVTAKSLAERFEVSTRTVYRDVDVLSAAGVPVFTSKGSGGGISLMEGFAFDKMLLSGQESESILLALQTLQAVRYPEVEQILNKLGALFKNSPVTNWVEVDFSPWGSGTEEIEKFNLIRQAILKRNSLEFDYVGTGGHRSARSANPMKLQFKGKAWYLWAWCRIKKDFRSFRITRMRNVRLLSETFEPKTNTEECREDTESGTENYRPMTKLWLKFKPRAEHRLYDDYDDEMIKHNQDGTMEIILHFPEDEWVYGYLLSFGPDLEVVEPEHIRNILLERMQEAIKSYI